MGSIKYMCLPLQASSPRHSDIATASSCQIMIRPYCIFFTNKFLGVSFKKLCLECSHEVSGEGLEEAVRKWMINPKTPKPHQTVLGEGGIMGDIEWVIVGGSYAGCCVSHERGEDLFTEDS